MFADINIFSILVAALAYMVIGAIWYSPFLFGTLWMEEMNFSPDKMDDQKKAMSFSAIVAVVLAIGLAFIANTFTFTTVDQALEAGVLLWATLTAAPMATDVIFQKQPFKVYVVNAAYHLVAILCMLIIIVSWQ